MEKTYTLKEAAALLSVHPTWLGNQYRQGLLRAGQFEVSPCGYTSFVFTGADIAEVQDSLILQAERARRRWRELYKAAVEEAKNMNPPTPEDPDNTTAPAPGEIDTTKELKPTVWNRTAYIRHTIFNNTVGRLADLFYWLTRGFK